MNCGYLQQEASLHSPGMGFAWRDFDEAFRRARALQPEAYHWGATAASSPLWLNAVARGMSDARDRPEAPASSPLVGAELQRRSFQSASHLTARPGAAASPAATPTRVGRAAAPMLYPPARIGPSRPALVHAVATASELAVQQSVPPAQLQRLLRGYDPEKVSELVTGFRFGFEIGGVNLIPGDSRL